MAAMMVSQDKKEWLYSCDLHFHEKIFGSAFKVFQAQFILNKELLISPLCSKVGRRL